MASTDQFAFFFVISLIVPLNSGLILDLSWDYSNETQLWPGGQPFHYTRKTANTDRGYWYAAFDFCTAEHSGTHFDAPFHFDQNGWTVAQVPVERLVANGSLVDISHIQEVRNLTVQDLEDYVKTNGDFPENTVVLVKFGWSKYYKSKEEFFVLDDKNGMNFPGISPEAAEWIVQKKQIVGVGVDSPGVDAGRSTENVIHRTFAKHKVYGLQHVKLVDDQLPAKGFVLVVSPMKLKEGTGAPVRLYAFVGDGIKLE